MLIKVCGLRDNFQEVAALKPDFAGMIFYEKSPRFVGKNDSEILKQKILGVKKVGVFVNASENYIFDSVLKYNLDFVQLHGGETVDFCEKIRQKVPVIKAFGILSEEDLVAAQNYAQTVDYLLFDTKTKGYGGSGQKFDWKMLGNIVFKKKFFLSGGISLEDLAEIKALKINDLAGVDLNSRFELSPAKKDIEKLQQAINFLRK
ncbi:MAG: phosphoribosylanthranilate isomerase [Bacteroidales bacterium]|nr:phosphoribosylanthranilate isomerase [Bacteroidales bacterium]